MLVAHLPADSAIGRAVNGEAVTWSRTDHLLAGVYDLLQAVTWQLGNMGAKSPSPRPKALPRPGISDTTIHYGSPRPLSEVKALLAASAPGAGQLPAEEVTADGR